MVFCGQSEGDGIVVGQIYSFCPEQNIGKSRPICLEEAIAVIQDELGAVKAKTKSLLGDSAASVFDAQMMLAQDKSWQKRIRELTEQEGFSLVEAIGKSADEIAARFTDSEDAYFRERARDIQDIRRHLEAAIYGYEQKVGAEYPPKTILLAETMTPAQLLQLPTENIAGLILREGSLLSHVVILAHMLGIAVLVNVKGLDELEIAGGTVASINESRGELLLGEDAVLVARSKAEKPEAMTESLFVKDISLQVYANISSVHDARRAFEKGAEGIGLCRTEFFYMTKQKLPEEEELYANYLELAQLANGRKMVFRTLDLGADKQLGYYGTGSVAHRGVKGYFQDPNIFRPQLSALLRVAAQYPIQILFPMVSTATEVRKIKETVNIIAWNLQTKKVDFKIPELGAMVETPEAVGIADYLATEMDFLSIGTNDLAQTGYGISREQQTDAAELERVKPFMLLDIKKVADSAQKRGKSVCVCGELAAEVSFAEKLAKIGVTAISVAPDHLSKFMKVQ